MAVQNGIDSRQALDPTSNPTFNSLTLTTPLTGANGGTGVANTGSTITLGGSLTTSGAFASTFTMTGITSVTFPTSGTLATTSQIPSLPVSLANGGTNANLTASNGGIFYSTATAGAILSGTATAKQILMSGASTSPAWSTATYPNTTTINQLLFSSAANVIGGLSTANNGLLVTSSAGVPSILAGPGTTGNMLQSNAAAAPSFSTATYPSTATSTGTILRANGTNWVATTATYPATTTSQQILYSTAANVVGQLTTANSSVVATNAAGTLAMRLFSVNVQTFIANGTYTPSTGMLYCLIELVGSGGGGGGSAATTAAQLAMGGGGGSGEYASGIFSAATVGASQVVTCPAGGNGGVAGGNNGIAGGTTSVGALISAAGGNGGLGGNASGTGGLNSGGFGGTGGAGGTVRVPGQSGGTGLSVFGTFQYNGIGAAGRFSGGGLIQSATGPGQAGNGRGGGGNGGFSFVSAAAQAGGNGSSGFVVITEYIIN